MVGHGGSSAGTYLAYPTSPIPSHCASIVTTSTLRVNCWNQLLHTFILHVVNYSKTGGKHAGSKTGMLTRPGHSRLTQLLYLIHVLGQCHSCYGAVSLCHCISAQVLYFIGLCCCWKQYFPVNTNKHWYIRIRTNALGSCTIYSGFIWQEERLSINS